MDLELSNKVVLVTAASKGLGRAAAQAFADEGARVVMSSRSEMIDKAGNEIRKSSGADVLAIRADVTKPDDIDQMVKTTLQAFGRIDILIINAGGPPPGNFFDLTPVDWEKAVNLTLMSAVRLCYAVIPIMLEQGEGSIVTTQSVSVKQPIDNLILSNSIRMAVIGLMKSLANEFGSRGIRVNSINPTYTWTERVEQLVADRAARSGKTIEEINAGLTASIPLGRMGTVDEFGKAIAWLASPAASYIHGHALMFDGGAVKTAL